MDGHLPGGHLDEAFRLAMLQAVTSGIDGFVSCIDRNRRILFLNRTLTRDISEILGKKIEDFMTPPYREAAIERVECAFVTQTPQRFESVVTLAEGTRRHIATRVIPFRAPGGLEVALQITTDVSEPRRLAEELQQSIEFRRRIVETLPDFVALVDRERRFIWVNRTAPQLQQKDVLGAKLDAFVSSEGLAEVIRVINRAFDSAESGQYETEAYRDAQTQAWYSVRVAPVLGEGGKVEHVLLITTDVTERKRAEQTLRETSEQLHRAQRLESLGQLAGGIAHDFNNLLQVIEGNLAFAKQILNEGGSPREELEQATRATERAAELTSHLLAIGRRTRVDSKRVELGELIGNTARLLRRSIPENVVLRYEHASAAYHVALDTPQFEQVLTSLCVNAWDAMPQGGTLTIQLQPEGPAHVVVSVRDTGVGISAEHLPRIFEPFFTTKGAGSGLGLAVAAGIVAAHGGVITAESDGKSGTTLRVKLPLVASSEPARAKAEAGQGAGLILVAEDEDLVRAQVARILARAGYTVLQACNGVRAVELFRAQHSEIALVILDVVMPELDGWQAFLQMEKLQPQLKVLFTTGYAANVLPEDFASRGARLLTKPYKPERLVAQVRELLQSARQA